MQPIFMLSADFPTLSAPSSPSPLSPASANAKKTRADVLQRLPFQGPIPPIRGKCPEGTRGGGVLARSA